MLKESAELHKKRAKRKRNRNKSHNRKRLSNEFLTLEVFESFKRLRKAFMEIFVLQHFDSTKLIRVKIDASDKAIERILCQSDDKNH